MLKFLARLTIGTVLWTAAPSYAHIIDGEETPVAEQMDKKPMSRLHVNGTGISFQEPDTAHMSAGVVATGTTAKEAMAENGKKMKSAIDSLMAAGVKRKHIQTSGLNLVPVYNHNGVSGRPIYLPHGGIASTSIGTPSEDGKLPERKIISYTVSNMVNAKTHDLDNLGAMLDSLVEAGSNNIANIRFSLKDDSVAKTEARKEAIKDARQKAQTMAEGAGLKLGRILVMGEGVNYNMSYSNEVQATSSGAFTGASVSGAIVQSGQQRITASVNMVYEIIQ